MTWYTLELTGIASKLIIVDDSTSAQTVLNTKDSNNCAWSSPHSNAFVDLDGDCLAGTKRHTLSSAEIQIRFVDRLFYSDLVFTCTGSNGQKSVQFWVNNRDQGFKMALQANLPNGAGPLSFADIGEYGKFRHWQVLPS